MHNSKNFSAYYNFFKYQRDKNSKISTTNFPANLLNFDVLFWHLAPLFQPTVILHGTRYMVNQTANVSLAAINATCNTSRDRYSDTASLIGMRIQNASGADITSFVDVTPYNISTETCGELVFIQWSDVFLYRSDLNGSNLTCFVETASKSVMSEKITLTFLEQQNPTLISTANPAVTNSINADTTLTTPVDISSESSPGTTTKNPPIIASTEMSTTTTTTTQVLSPPYAGLFVYVYL